MIRHWRIEGYDSLTKIYDQEVEVSCFSEKQIQALLMALAAKAGLGFTEIVGAYARRRSRIANNFLSVRKEGRPYPVFSCGDNPHFIARVVAPKQRTP
jgi:hypothetical protein